MRRNRLACVAFLAMGIVVSTTARSVGQSEGESERANRNEVGLRLRALERALEAQRDNTGRRRALQSLQRATTVFLLGQTVEAGRQLDLARHALDSAAAPAPAFTWADSYSLRTTSRLLDVDTRSIAFHVTPFYGTKLKSPEGAQVTVALSNSEGKTLASRTVAMGAELSDRLALNEIAEGDYWLCAELRLEKQVLATFRHQVSFAARLNERLKALKVVTSGLSSRSTSSEDATLRAWMDLLVQLHEGKAGETNYPAARLLSDAEQLALALREKRPYLKGRLGQSWIALKADGSVVPARMLVPTQVAAGKPLPLLIALHGARGSENLFFEGYGAGLTARLAEERGWILVAPRNGIEPGLIDAIAEIVPVDTQRIYLVGHSMGAAQAVAFASRNPTLFAGVAALGGGGGVKPSKPLEEVPFFVGVGVEDFAKPGSRSLRESLERAGVKHVTYREYPDVEHLSIVQFAIRDVLEFFAGAKRTAD